MSFAWIIDEDLLFDPTSPIYAGEQPEVGITGPGGAPDWMIQLLEQGDTDLGVASQLSAEGSVIYQFVMLDDDQIPYYKGRMITDEGDTEAACFAPLDNFGAPNAGCTSIEYTGHPEMDIG